MFNLEQGFFPLYFHFFFFSTLQHLSFKELFAVIDLIYLVYMIHINNPYLLVIQ